MSHYLDMKTQLTDPEALRRALLHMGFSESEVKVHQNNVNIKDYMGRRTDKKASVVVDYNAASRVGNYPSNDLGFYKTSDGTYTCHMDDGFLERQKGFMDKLGTYYNYEKSKIELEARKIPYEELKDDTGRLQLKCQFKKKNKGLSISL